MKASHAFWPTLVLGLFAATAHGALRAVEEAYELALSAVGLPASQDGYLTLRPCERCRPEVLRVTSETIYATAPANPAVDLEQFRKAAGKVTLRSRALVYVYYDPRSRRVRRLVLDAG